MIDVPGWLYPEEGPLLAEWGSRSTGILVEIGSFAGKSTLWIASKAQHQVVSIDPHTGNEEMQKGRECFMPEAWDEEDQVVDSLPLLRRNLRHGGATNVTIICATSDTVAEWWNAPIGFLFIDGNHGPQVQTDYRNWAKHLTEDGILAFHDTAIPAIAEACRMATADGWNERLVVQDCLRIFTR